MVHTKPQAETVQQLLTQSMSPEHRLGEGENFTTFALTGFGDAQADREFIIRIPII